METDTAVYLGSSEGGIIMATCMCKGIKMEVMAIPA